MARVPANPFGPDDLVHAARRHKRNPRVGRLPQSLSTRNQTLGKVSAKFIFRQVHTIKGPAAGLAAAMRRCAIPHGNGKFCDASWSPRIQ
jgi:hypothetical protein